MLRNSKNRGARQCGGHGGRHLHRAAFGKIVESLVKDLIMPPIGVLLGKVDFSNLFVVLKQGAQAGPYLSVEAAQKAGAVTFNYGLFINTVISFTIVAFAVFLLIRAINKLSPEEQRPGTDREWSCCGRFATL